MRALYSLSCVYGRTVICAAHNYPVSPVIADLVKGVEVGGSNGVQKEATISNSGQEKKSHVVVRSTRASVPLRGKTGPPPRA